MATFQTQFFSNSLGIITDVIVYLPIDKNSTVEAPYSGTPLKTLYLLHGAWAGHSAWIEHTKVINYAKKHNFALVMPNVGNSFYADTAGAKYFTYISEELINFMELTFPLSKKAKDRYIAGLSMGGYGALKVALNNPSNYKAVASLSGALDIEKRTGKNGLSLGFDFKALFGDPVTVKNTKNDLFWLIENNQNQLPIYLACGTEDFIYEDTIKFKKHLIDNNVDFTYEQQSGGHDWDFWDTYIKKAIEWFEQLD